MDWDFSEPRPPQRPQFSEGAGDAKFIHIPATGKTHFWQYGDSNTDPHHHDMARTLGSANPSRSFHTGEMIPGAVEWWRNVVGEPQMAVTQAYGNMNEIKDARPDIYNNFRNEYPEAVQEYEQHVEDHPDWYAEHPPEWENRSASTKTADEFDFSNPQAPTYEAPMVQKWIMEPGGQIHMWDKRDTPLDRYYHADKARSLGLDPNLHEQDSDMRAGYVEPRTVNGQRSWFTYDAYGHQLHPEHIQALVASANERTGQQLPDYNDVRRQRSIKTASSWADHEEPGPMGGPDEHRSFKWLMPKHEYPRWGENAWFWQVDGYDGYPWHAHKAEDVGLPYSSIRPNYVRGYGEVEPNDSTLRVSNGWDDAPEDRHHLLTPAAAHGITNISDWHGRYEDDDEDEDGSFEWDNVQPAPPPQKYPLAKGATIRINGTGQQGVVTNLGTVAGFIMDATGKAVRFDNNGVTVIAPAPLTPPKTAAAQVMYHVAPRSARESILTHGIDHTRGMNEWSGDAHDPGNYLFDNDENAYRYIEMQEELDHDNFGHSQGYDVWHVSPDAQTLKSDPQVNDIDPAIWQELGYVPGKAQFSASPIPPERLRLHDTTAKTSAANTMYHVAPRSGRESIMAEGMPRGTMVGPAPGAYHIMFNEIRPEEAPFDTWGVNTEGLHMVPDDMEDFTVYDPIPPDRLRLLSKRTAMAWDDPPQGDVMYHAAPRSLRDQIMREGLRQTDPSLHDSIHAWDSPDNAHKWGKRVIEADEPYDVWAIHGHTDWNPDLYFAGAGSAVFDWHSGDGDPRFLEDAHPGAYYTQSVPPERIHLLNEGTTAKTSGGVTIRDARPDEQMTDYQGNPYLKANEYEGESIVAEHQGQPVGNFMYLPPIDPGDGIFLDHAWVHPEHRGKGIGRQLFDEMTRRYPNERVEQEVGGGSLMHQMTDKYNRERGTTAKTSGVDLNALTQQFAAENPQYADPQYAAGHCTEINEHFLMWLKQKDPSHSGWKWMDYGPPEKFGYLPVQPGQEPNHSVVYVHDGHSTHMIDFAGTQYGQPFPVVRTQGTTAKTAGETPNQRARRMQEVDAKYPDRSEVVHQLPGGWSIRKPTRYGDVAREGYMMRNCWIGKGEAFPKNEKLLVNGTNDYHSLRDPNNIPVASFYYDEPQGFDRYVGGNTVPAGNGRVHLVYGERNHAPLPEHLDMMRQWTDSLPHPVTWGHVKQDEEPETVRGQLGEPRAAKTGHKDKAHPKHKHLVTRLFNDGGFTVTPDLDEAPNSGYYVSQSGGKVIPADDFSADDIAGMQADVEPGQYIGAWLDNGEVYLDTTHRFDDLEPAMSFGRAHNQQALYDAYEQQVLPIDQRIPTAEDEPDDWEVTASVSWKRAWAWRVAYDEAQRSQLQTFFDQAAQGLRPPDNDLGPEDISHDPDHLAFRDAWKQYAGPFDRHIETSIPGYAKNMVAKGVALTKAFPGSSLLDIAASHGSFGKALSATGGIQTTSLDSSPVFRDDFMHRTPPVEGAGFTQHSFGEPFVDNTGQQIESYPNESKHDIVHESMAFQFIDPDRTAQVAQTKMHLNPGGLAIFDEKFTNADPAVEQQNEATKNNWKLKHFNQQALDAKDQEVGLSDTWATGMRSTQAEIGDFEQILKRTFRYVAPYWKSGNFAGFAASDNPHTLQKYLDAYSQEAQAASKAPQTAPNGTGGVGQGYAMPEVAASLRTAQEGQESFDWSEPESVNQQFNRPGARWLFNHKSGAVYLYPNDTNWGGHHNQLFDQQQEENPDLWPGEFGWSPKYPSDEGQRYTEGGYIEPAWDDDGNQSWRPHSTFGASKSTARANRAVMKLWNDMGQQHRGMGTLYTPNPSLRKQGMAADPEFINNWIQEHGPWLYHGVREGHDPQQVMQQGIAPGQRDYDDYGGDPHKMEDWQMEDWWHKPRPNHVYMVTNPENAYGTNLMRVDLRKLDPANLNPDDDQLRDLGGVPGKGEEGWVYEKDPNHPTLGEQAEALDWGSNPEDTHDAFEAGTVAHRGTIPPEAIEHYATRPDDAQPWQPVKTAMAMTAMPYHNNTWRRGKTAEYRGRHTAPGPEGAPFHDAATPNDDSDYSGAYPPDVYDHPEWYMHRDNEGFRETVQALHAARGNPEAPVTIYRAAPKPEFNTGDWVTPSLEYAKQHAMQWEESDDMPVHSVTVPAKHLNTNGDYLPEWGYNGPSTTGQRIARMASIEGTDDTDWGHANASERVGDEISEAGRYNFIDRLPYTLYNDGSLAIGRFGQFHDELPGYDQKRSVVRGGIYPRGGQWVHQIYTNAGTKLEGDPEFGDELKLGVDPASVTSKLSDQFGRPVVESPDMGNAASSGWGWEGEAGDPENFDWGAPMRLRPKTAGAREDFAGMPGWAGVPEHVYDWLDRMHPNEQHGLEGDCINPKCDHNWTDEEAHELTQYGEIKCPNCGLLQNREGNAASAKAITENDRSRPGGGTRSGLTMQQQGDIGEEIIKRIGELPSGRITHHFGDDAYHNPFDFATEDEHGNPWAVEVKTNHSQAGPRFRLGGAQEVADKRRFAAENGMRPAVAGVRLNYYTNKADVFFRPQLTDPHMSDRTMQHVGTIDFSDLNPFHDPATGQTQVPEQPLATDIPF